MKIGRCGSVSEDGVTIVYDANSEAMYELRIPLLPSGTEIRKDRNGNWHPITTGLAKETKNRLEQADKFYYQTRNILRYTDYLYVCGRFPTNCATKFEENPFFLTEITRDESDYPICPATVIDSEIILSTFQDRIREMKYIITHILKQNENGGHTWISYDDFNKRVLAQLARDGHPLFVGTVKAFLHYFENEFYFDGYRVGLRSTYEREKNIYKEVMYAISLPTTLPLYNPSYEEDLDPDQNKAVRNLILRGGHISILVGGPGTGKTTISKSIVDKVLYQFPNLNIYMLAPTGKAARRIKEVFGSRNIEVSTIHKFLGYGHTLTKRELDKIRKADIIFIDEAGMLDLEIFERLLSLINIDRTKIILSGDVNQLPSIGAGNILADLIKIGVHTEKLTTNHRSLGTIVSNAHLINDGNFFLKYDNTFQVIDISTAFTDYLVSQDRECDVIISPYRTEQRLGNTGTINKLVQQRKFTYPAYNGYHVGDTVIMLHTNYKQGYFNGETGTVICYLPNGDYIIGLGDREVTVKDKTDMTLGYSITVHKSQGSEYPIVDIYIPQYSPFITRKMFYTAVTRAKQKARIWSTLDTLKKVILNNPEEDRRTFLSTF